MGRASVRSLICVYLLIVGGGLVHDDRRLAAIASSMSVIIESPKRVVMSETVVSPRTGGKRIAER